MYNVYENKEIRNAFSLEWEEINVGYTICFLGCRLQQDVTFWHAHKKHTFPVFRRNFLVVVAIQCQSTRPIVPSGLPNPT